MTNLLTKDYTDVEDRLIIRAMDPADHSDWLKVLPFARPQFLHNDPDGKDVFVRWSMPKEDAQRFGLWGAGCACCGAGGATNEVGDTWEFDTVVAETDWYLEFFEGVEQ